MSAPRAGTPPGPGGDARPSAASGHSFEQLKAQGVLMDAIFNSANFSQIATDERGVIQIFNVGAEAMLGYDAVDVVDKITPADISDPQELIKRAAELSVELDTEPEPHDTSWDRVPQ